LDHSGFTAPFHPRAVVIGPDGLLYVSTRGFVTGLEAYVLRFNPLSGKFIDVFTSFKPAASDCSKHLHRPEGLVFGPNGKLYITSFRADPSDTDKILVFDRRTKQCVDQIDLYAAGQDRAFAQALLFGPKGKLFVPINNTGEVRRYNVRTKTYDIIIPAGGNLLSPWYLTFGETDPRTLEYDD
jgi:glucose/arabinose dehydrogenase